MAGVVRMPRQYCKCPVDLFGHYQAGELVRQRHGPQRKSCLRLLGRPRGPATRGPDGENNHLLACIPAYTEPFRQSFRRQRFSTTIQQYEPSWGTRPLLRHKGEQRFLIAESNRFDTGIGCDAFQIEICGLAEQITPGPLGNVSEGEIQIRLSPKGPPTWKDDRGTLSEPPTRGLVACHLFASGRHASPIQHRLDHRVAPHA
jgi:hypothetical protein